MIPSSRCNFLLTALLLCAAGRAGFSESITLTPSADTTIFEQFPTRNLGGVPNFIVGGIAHDTTGSGIRARALIKFELTNSLPSNAVVTSATLRLKVEAIAPDPNVDGTVELHRLLKSWGEGRKTDFKGVTASINEATWNDRFARVAGTGWTTPGASAPADFLEAVSSAVFVEDDSSYTFPSSAGLVRDIQFWLSQPAQNFGWVLINENESSPRSARRFASRDDVANPNNRPQLRVEYTLSAPAEPPHVETIELKTNAVVFSVSAAGGKTHRVEWSDSLPASQWQVLTNVESAPAIFTVSDPVTSARRFYRIVRP